jgi:hypothetical protein
MLALKGGKLYEAIKAFVGHRSRCALYHTALEVGGPDGRFVIESAPIRDSEGRVPGVVAEGPVGTPLHTPLNPCWSRSIRAPTGARQAINRLRWFPHRSPALPGGA